MASSRVITNEKGGIVVRNGHLDIVKKMKKTSACNPFVFAATHNFLTKSQMLILCSTIDQAIYIFDVDSGELVKKIEEQMFHGSIFVVKITKDDSCAVIGTGSEICIFNMDNIALTTENIKLQFLYGHSSDIIALDVSSDNSKMVSGCRSGNICVWDFVNKVLLFSSQTLFDTFNIRNPFRYITITSSNRNYVYVVGNEIRYCDMADASVIDSFIVNDDRIETLDLLCDDKILCCKSKSTKLLMLENNKFEEPLTINFRDNRIHYGGFYLEDGESFVAMFNNCLELYKMSPYEEFTTFEKVRQDVIDKSSNYYIVVNNHDDTDRRVV